MLFAWSWFVPPSLLLVFCLLAFILSVSIWARPIVSNATLFQTNRSN
jgi:hypothetical protein